MSRDPDQPAAAPAEETFLRRWSRRKRAAADEASAPPSSIPQEPQPATGPVQGLARETGHAESAQAAAAAADPPLPPIESLTFESDFRAFLQPHVAEDIKRQALRKLLHDPRFNTMDGLDVYIDDYSVPSPLEPELVRTLEQARYIFDPPPTRVNAAGHVEDVPPEAGEVPGATPEGTQRLGENGIEDPAHQTTPSSVGGTSPHERQVLVDDPLPSRSGTRDSTDGAIEQ